MNKRQFNKNWIQERLGAMPSPWDPRSADYAVRTATLKDIEQLPQVYEDLLQWVPDNLVRDQGNIGSCVGWDFNFVLEVQGSLIALDTSLRSGFSTIDLSAGWIYQFSREHSFPPVPPGMEGSTNFGACKALNKVGAIPESRVPTDTVSPWDPIQITNDMLIEALNWKIVSYHNVPADPSSVKAAIYGLTFPMPYKMPDGSPGKSPLASAYPVYESFKESYDDGIVPVPKNGESLLGGHSSMIVGWKIIDGKPYWINFNSWGKDVGDEGLFYIPEEYPFYGTDFWLIMLTPTPPTPEKTCIIEQSNGIASFLNHFTSTGKYYYGYKV